MTYTTSFAPEHLAKALDIVRKANARAARNGIADQFTVTHSTSVVSEVVAGGLHRSRELVTLVVEGKPLVIAGYTFLASVTWDAETGLSSTRSAPGVDVDLSAHRLTAHCDHCGTDRRRSAVYVLRAEDGTTRQVGSSCLTLFLGVDVSGALAGVDVSGALAGVDVDWASKLGELSNQAGGDGREGTTYLLALAAAVVERHGWAASAATYSTVSRVRDILHPPTGSHPSAVEAREEAQAVVALIAEDGHYQERAEAILAYVLSDLQGSGEYVTNLRNACTGVTVDPRNFALVVSAVSVWRRAQEQAVQAQVEAAQAPSVHVGAVGDRLKGLQLQVRLVRTFEGNYGTTTLLGMVDAAGNHYKWFASSYRGEEPGDKLVLTGTVKGHETYRDVAETVLTRCKVEGD